ncbi:MAG: IS4 family transposase, partial [Bacteroidales bacterium]|nr:IS4 family transposase [Bacteroidales bacterium]
LSIKLEKEKIFISKQGVDNRFNESAVEFMKELMCNVLSEKLDLEESLKIATCFNRIIVKDATLFQLPAKYLEKYKGSGGGASEAGIKLQYEYNLKANTGLDIELQSACTPDVKSKLQNIQPKDLRIEDLGYFKLGRFNEIIKSEAYFLSRLKYNVLVFSKDDDQFNQINIDKVVKNMKVGEKLDLQVYLGKKEKLPVRLILERVPNEIAAEKRRKLKTDKQNKRKNISKERLVFCDVNAYITNADQDDLPIELIRLVYSLRWQIEIIFKSWKSTFKLDKVKQMKIQRFDCINYGTLLQIIICTKLYNYYKTFLWNKSTIELSKLKSFQYLIKKMDAMKDYIKNSQTKRMAKLFEDTKEILARKCRKERKKGSITPMMIMSKISLT